MLFVSFNQVLSTLAQRTQQKLAALIQLGMKDQAGEEENLAHSQTVNTELWKLHRTIFSLHGQCRLLKAVFDLMVEERPWWTSWMAFQPC